MKRLLLIDCRLRLCTGPNVIGVGYARCNTDLWPPPMPRSSRSKAATATVMPIWVGRRRHHYGWSRGRGHHYGWRHRRY